MAMANGGCDPVAVFERGHDGRVAPLDFARGIDRGTVTADIEGLAAEPLLEAAERFPWSRRVRTALWRYIERRGRYELVPALRAAVVTAGADISARLLVHDGERRFADGDAAGAAAQFRAAVEDDPTCAEAWNDLGVALHALGRDEAVAALATGIAVGGPRGSDCLLNRAAILFSLGRLAEARRDAIEGLRHDPDSEDLAEILGAASEALEPMTFDARVRLAA
jgi:tetratricopeptide (TPR) repeat protein